MAGANATSFDLPPLPDYTLRPLTPLSSWASDALITAAVPVIGYWVVSLLFHIIDVYDFFPHYRLHTPAEVLKRNHVSRFEVLRDVVLQQIVQVGASLLLAVFDETPTVGKADYDIAWYAQKIRLAQRAVPYVMSTIGLDPSGTAIKFADARPTLASVAMGGKYPGLFQSITVGGEQTLAPAFASWELAAATFIYWYGIPAIQFSAAIVIMDAWEYMVHRTMHLNKWLYGESHRLQTPVCTPNLVSHLSLAPPPPLRAVRLWCPLQPPSRGLRHGHPWRGPLVLAHRHDYAPVDMVLYRVDCEDRA